MFARFVGVTLLSLFGLASILVFLPLPFLLGLMLSFVGGVAYAHFVILPLALALFEDKYSRRY